MGGILDKNEEKINTYQGWQDNLKKGTTWKKEANRAKGQALGRRPLTAKKGLYPGPVNVGNVVDKLAVRVGRVSIEYFGLTRITLPVLYSLR
jgi:hypothetical protein